jgi:hypothetical protein
MAGRECEMLKRKLTQLEVEGCVGAGRGLANTFDERQVKPLQKSSIQERIDAKHAGQRLVMKAKVGTYVGIQNRAGDEDDTFWVAQLVDSQRGTYKGTRAHIYEKVQERHKEIELNGAKTGLNRGEFAFTVKFLKETPRIPTE